MFAIDAKLEYEGNTLALAFSGRIKERVDVDPNDPISSVKLRVIGFRMSAQADGMTVTLEQNDVDVDPKSRLRMSQSFPPNSSSAMSSHSPPASRRLQGEHRPS
ncbi:hypothetical protein [Streptomyces rubellomurinus]|nr:hypothetical protein [Streptomyces rubellomurinus]